MIWYQYDQYFYSEHYIIITHYILPWEQKTLCCTAANLRVCLCMNISNSQLKLIDSNVAHQFHRQHQSCLIWNINFIIPIRIHSKRPLNEIHTIYINVYTVMMYYYRMQYYWLLLLLLSIFINCILAYILLLYIYDASNTTILINDEIMKYTAILWMYYIHINWDGP